MSLKAEARIAEISEAARRHVELVDNLIKCFAADGRIGVLLYPLK